MQRSETSAPRASEAPPAAAGGSELPGRCCSGCPRPRPSPGERRRPPSGRRLLPGAARPGGLARDLKELVEAAPVAAQVAPHRRQVAELPAAQHDVVASGRGEMQQK